MSGKTIGLLDSAAAIADTDQIPLWNGTTTKRATVPAILRNPLPLTIAGVTRAIQYFNPAGEVQKIEIFWDSAVTDYSAAATQGSIQWAIDQLGAVNKGGQVLIHPGVYPLAAALVVDYDWIQIQGTVKPHWNKWVNSWPNHDTAGTPGGAQLVAASGQAAVTVGTGHMHSSDTRHKGLTFRDLYFYGQNAATYGIYDAAATDVCEVSGCLIQGFQTAAIAVGWDAANFHHNQVQDNDGYVYQALSGAVFHQVCNNLFCDCGKGLTVASSAYGNIISNNQLVRISNASGPAIALAGTRNVVTENFLNNATAAASFTVEITETTAGTNTIFGNIQLYGGNSGGCCYTQGYLCSDHHAAQLVTKVASDNVRNSSDAAVSKTSMSYNTAKTVIFRAGLRGSFKILFDLKSDDYDEEEEIWGQCWANVTLNTQSGTLDYLVTEQTMSDGTYVTYTTTVTRDIKPGDRIYLRVKAYCTVRNFRFAYDDVPQVAVPTDATDSTP